MIERRIGIVIKHFYTENTNFIRPFDDVPFKTHANLNTNVATIYLFPTITREQVKSFMQRPTEGVVLQSYGLGNIPTSRTDLLQVLKEAVEQEIVIVNISQCPQGSVASTYETGCALANIGIINGRDMTVEAAYTKLCFVLGIPGLSFEKRVQMYNQNLRGEITVNSNNNNFGFHNNFWK